ncbi:Potassium channel protein [hydrothermal vent metagenome]|uniref:Potassium channel protein n=1 Tax=hydrothermal vent metagenome TaxID=652676 RepID=A0A170QCC3_9ZZZZ
MFSYKSSKFLAYFTILISVGTLGFYVIGGDEWSLIDSFYMTIFTITTVGFGEIHPLNDLGRLWTSFVIVFGVSGFLYMLSEIGAELVEFRVYKENQKKRKIRKMKNHYIICGYGRMGAVIARELHEKNYPFVVVEIDQDKIDKISALGYQSILGDATIEKTLEEAGIHKAAGIVVCLNNDPDNLFVTLTARSLNHDAFLVSRCSQINNKPKLKQAGANKVVNPYTAGGHKMAELLISPELEDTVSLSLSHGIVDLAIDEVNLTNLNSFHGVKIKDSTIREEFNLIIVGLVNGDGSYEINPDPELLLSADHTVMIMGQKRQLEQFKDKFPSHTHI